MVYSASRQITGGRDTTAAAAITSGIAALTARFIRRCRWREERCLSIGIEECPLIGMGPLGPDSFVLRL